MTHMRGQGNVKYGAGVREITHMGGQGNDKYGGGVREMTHMEEGSGK